MRLTDKGVVAIEGKSYVEYDDKEVFFSNGEDYGAYRNIKDIMAQARVEILVIDPYVDENLLDMCASLDASINVRVLSEHLKGDFKVVIASCRSNAARSKCGRYRMTGLSSSMASSAISWAVHQSRRRKGDRHRPQAR